MQISDTCRFLGDRWNKPADVLIVGMPQGCLVRVLNLTGQPHLYMVDTARLVRLHT